jgi:zinc transporter ZupT
VGYITNEGFPLAFAVIVENSGGGFAIAGPVANRVLQAAVN